jgi:hypothetical protein
MNRRSAIGRLCGLLAMVIHPGSEAKRTKAGWLFRCMPPQCSECVYLQEMILGEHRYGHPVTVAVREWHNETCSRQGHNGEITPITWEEYI